MAREKPEPRPPAQPAVAPEEELKEVVELGRPHDGHRCAPGVRRATVRLLLGDVRLVVAVVGAVDVRDREDRDAVDARPPGDRTHALGARREDLHRGRPHAVARVDHGVRARERLVQRLEHRGRLAQEVERDVAGAVDPACVVGRGDVPGQDPDREPAAQRLADDGAARVPRPAQHHDRRHVLSPRHPPIVGVRVCTGRPQPARRPLRTRPLR
ncbi:hypothetical protein GCM10025864_21110 [Luteimicrobium album]|uniref:Uncharacterized protein n=1 Tax=Luteimicrobium album TaxID=1054550 RepID=A0ABQ6I1L6_9MICO|nr:hypothetical protein GCM10025864_21110 [Luteimicrobium album]